MEELKIPDLQLGQRVEEVVFDNAELRTVRISYRAYSDAPDITRGQVEGEWLSVLKGEITLTIGQKSVTLKNAQKTFIPSETPYRVESTSDPCMVLAVFHK